MKKLTSITAIENEILTWDKTNIGKGNFGATTFLYRRKEFGHIHHNGDLDIDFGKEITRELLEKHLVQKHLYVPATSITFRVTNKEKLSFAISLLRLSYLVNLIKDNKEETIVPNILEQELAKLPEDLRLIYLK